MPRGSAFLWWALLLLSGLTPAACYSYQTEPLFLTFSELAALEAESRREDTDHVLPAAGEDRRARAVQVRCHEDSVEVAVLGAPRFDPGLPAEPRRLRLGPVPAPPCTARRSGPGRVSIRAPLLRCGGSLTLTETELLYSNLLLYIPPAGSFQGWGAAIPAGSFQGWGAAIPVQCRYRRRFSVSSGGMKPIWSPFISHPARTHQPSLSSPWVLAGSAARGR